MYIGITKTGSFTKQDTETYTDALLDSVYAFNTLQAPPGSAVIQQIHCKLDYVKPYTARCLDIIRDSTAETFVVHDMPNTSEGGFGWAWQQPAPFAAWWAAVADEIRMHAPNVLLGFPRMKQGYDIDLLQRSDYDFTKECAYAFHKADFLTVDAVWACGDDWTEMYNALYRVAYISHVYEKPLVITYHNRNNNIKKRVKGAQYVEFVEGLQKIDGIIGAFCHTLSSDDPAELWVSWRTDKKESIIPSMFRDYLRTKS
jgi:hypothetical protein